GRAHLGRRAPPGPGNLAGAAPPGPGGLDAAVGDPGSGAVAAPGPAGLHLGKRPDRPAGPRPGAAGQPPGGRCLLGHGCEPRRLTIPGSAKAALAPEHHADGFDFAEMLPGPAFRLLGVAGREGVIEGHMFLV